MKLIFSHSRRSAGGALLVVLFVTALIGTMLAVYLTMVRNQNAVNARSQTWNLTLPLIESGIEEALAHLNCHGQTNLACSGWARSGGTYTLTRYLDDNYYNATITNWVAGSMASTPIIEVRGYMSLPLLTAVSPTYVLADASQSLTTPPATGYVRRGIRVSTQPNFIFTKGIVARGTIDLNGNNITTDSFDSGNALYSTNGLYSASKRRDNGDIASDASITNSVSVGNANIYGHVETGPNGTVSVGPQGSVGSLAWHSSGGSGIQTGYSDSSMNVSFPDAVVPFNGGASTPAGGWITNSSSTLTTNQVSLSSLTYPSGVSPVATVSTTSSSYPSDSSGPVTTNWNGGHTQIRNYTYPTYYYTNTAVTSNITSSATYYDYILDSGNYQLTTLSGSVYVSGNAVLYVTTSLSVSALTIKPGQNLKLYSSAASVSLAGNNSANSDGSSLSFQYYGLPANTSLTFSGNAGFTGTIYAPSATFTLNGGGNNTTDFIGACIANSVVLNGHFNFHYDERLGREGPFRGWVVGSWSEMTPAEVATVTTYSEH